MEFIKQDYEEIKQDYEEIKKKFEEITIEFEEKKKVKANAEKEKTSVEGIIKTATESLAMYNAAAENANAKAAEAVEEAKAAAAAVEDAKAAATSDPSDVATAMETLRRAKDRALYLEDDAKILLALNKQAAEKLKLWEKDLNHKNKKAMAADAAMQKAYEERDNYIEQMINMRKILFQFQAGGRRYKSKRHNRISKRHKRTSKRHNRISKRHNRTSKRHNRISKIHK